MKPWSAALLIRLLAVGLSPLVPLGSMKFLNTPHLILTPGLFFCGFAANRDAWNALPEELKKLHMEWYRKAPEVWGEEYKKGFIKWIPIFKKKGITIIELPAEDRAKLVSKAEIVYKNWIERMEKKGLPGREVFDYYMAKRKEIAGF